MDGVITVKENRSSLTQMKEWIANKVSNLFKDKSTEEIIDQSVDIAKNAVTVAGSVATVALMACPADGPFGEIATILATPALVKAVESSRGLLKALFVEKDAEQISAALADLQSNVADISIPDRNTVETQSLMNVQNVDQNQQVELSGFSR